MKHDKILSGNEWFYTVSKDVLLEDEYESQVLANAGDIFPDYLAVPFKQTIGSAEFGTAKPDFLIFEREFRSWWVIEVEMSRHSLTSHVEPQIAALAHGNFTENHVEHVASFYQAQADVERVRSLMTTVQANVLVVINDERDEWLERLRLYDASMITVKPYQSRQGKYIFRQIGNVPGQNTSILSTIQIRRDVSRAIVVDNRAALPFEQKQVIELLIDGTPTKWRCHFVANTLMLFCLEGRFPIESSAGSYALVRLASGEYSVERQVTRIVGH